MTALDDIVAKFRKASPNVALAFDEVQRRLSVLEKPPMDPPPTNRRADIGALEYR